MEERRADGMSYLAGRLPEQRLLRAGLTPAEAADVLWAITSFDAFDLLYTGRGLPVDDVADTLVDMAEQALLAPSGPVGRLDPGTSASRHA
jgi:hypothetical protein